MAPQDRVIQRLCQNDFARHEAKRLYSLASQQTGKNTGHDLGDAHGALAEICAFLASEKTGTGDVTQEQARASACIDRKIFENALQIVRRVVLKSNAAPDYRRVTYKSLVCQYGVREDAGVAMLEVTETLQRKAELERHEVESPVLQCAIFYWVCTNIFELTVPDFPVYHEQHKFSQKAWSLALRLLHKHCSHMVEKLAALAMAAAPSIQTRSRTRSHLVLQNGNTNLLDSPKRSNLDTPTKEQARKELAHATENGTSPKRHKGSHSVGRVPKTPAREKEAPATLSGKNVVVSIRKRIEPTEVIVVQSGKKARPCAAWEAQRPNPCQGESTPQQTPCSTIVCDTEPMDSTPMTSTGMSDVFSDSTPNTQSTRGIIRMRLRPPSLLRASAVSRDAPRPRHRNLRATFLDGKAYSWKPDGQTKRRLERARKLEEVLISMYGDPWEKLHGN